ncbi:MAG TPA: hypothetical protein VH478_04925 [Trebonia sp.]|nr:hypothetical protein [Trebonia sp.]
MEGLSSRWGTRRLSAHVKAVWAELLLFAQLVMAPNEPSDEDFERARLLRVVLAEVGDQAARPEPFVGGG